MSTDTWAASTPTRELDRWAEATYRAYLDKGVINIGEIDSVLALYPQGSVTPGKEKLYRILGFYYYGGKDKTASAAQPSLVRIEKNKKQEGDSMRFALILAGIGESYRAFGQLDKADSALRASMRISSRYVDSLGIAYSNGRYASVLLEQGVIDTARVMPHYRKSILYARSFSEQGEAVAEVGNYASMLWEKGRAGEAHALLMEAVTIPGDSLVLSRLYNTLAQVCKSMGQYEPALKHAQRAYYISIRNGYNANAMNAALAVQQVYDSLDNFKSAYDWSLIHKSLIEMNKFGGSDDKQIAALKKERAEQQQENEYFRQEHEKHLADMAWFQWLAILVSILAVILVLVTGYLLYQRKGLREAQTALRNSNQRVEDQNAELKKYLNVRDRLISVASHDLRAPLATVKNLLELFNNDRLTPDELRSLVTMLEAQYQRSLDMADNLLLWAKSQLEGIEAKATSFDLMEMTEDVLSFSKPVIESSGVKVQLSKKGEARAYADVEMSKFVIRNLLHNAVKFSEAGDLVSVDIVCEDSVVRWCIQDEGPGMSKTQIDELFRVGSRLDSKDPKKGAGIGLYLSHYFAELNDGQLLAWSEIGKGSTFCFELKSASGTAPIPKN